MFTFWQQEMKLRNLVEEVNKELISTLQIVRILENRVGNNPALFFSPAKNEPQTVSQIQTYLREVVQNNQTVTPVIPNNGSRES